MSTPTPIQKLASHALLWLQRTSEVAVIEGIRLADGEASPHFGAAVPAAIRLIKDLDRRRFRRLQRHITWIVNSPLPRGGGAYHHPTQTCRLDFTTTAPSSDTDYLAAAVATTLIHEATHALIESRGIRYIGDIRGRIERCCVREQNRFLRRLSQSRPDLAALLHKEFDEAEWHDSWTATPFQNMCDSVRRVRRRNDLTRRCS